MNFSGFVVTIICTGIVASGVIMFVREIVAQFKGKSCGCCRKCRHDCRNKNGNDYT